MQDPRSPTDYWLACYSRVSPWLRSLGVALAGHFVVVCLLATDRLVHSECSQLEIKNKIQCFFPSVILDGGHFVDFVSHMNLIAVLRALLVVALFCWSSSACNMHSLLRNFSSIHDSTHILVSCVLHMLSSFLYFPICPSSMLLLFIFLMSCESTISLSINLFLVLSLFIGFSWPLFALLIYAHYLAPSFFRHLFSWL